MAQRRMFSLKIVDTDSFLDMPQSSQLLYFHLSMRADDDGFVSNPKKVMRMIGSQDDDLKVLFTKRFVLPFESGVCVIKHWKIHNYIQNDRHTPTQYVKEMAQLKVDPETQKYQLKKGEDNVSKVDTQVRVGKDRLGKDKEREVASLPTPRDISSRFFSEDSNDEQEVVISRLVESGISLDVARREISKFVSYWTEKNKSGTKQRWEMEKTFEVQRRLATWFSKINGFNKNVETKTRGISIIT